MAWRGAAGRAEARTGTGLSMGLKVDPVSLKLFVAVCETGTIAAAAEREFIAASAISKRIAEMEHWVGTPLLNRGQRGVSPTAAGTALLRHAREILRSMRQLQAELGDHSQGVRGHVHVLANVSSMAEFVPEDIQAFVGQHPDVRITLEERRSADVVRGIEDGEADIGISRAFVPSRGLTCHPHRFDHFGVAMDEAHPLAREACLAFKDTLRFERIGMSLDPANHASLQALMVQAAAEHGQELFYRVQVGNYDAALRLLRGSMALAILPMEAAHVRATSLGLRMVPLSDAWARQQFIVCVRSAEPASPAAHKVLAHLLARGSANEPPVARPQGS